MNDADYSSTVEEYNAKEFESAILPELVVLYTQYYGPHKMQEYDGEKYDIMWLNIPGNDWGWAHTIKDITLEYIDENGILWTADLSSMSEEDIEEYLKLAEFNTDDEVDD